MSDKDCSCSWCKKNINIEEAEIIRTNFISKIFGLMFKNLFNSQEEIINKAIEKFKPVSYGLITNTLNSGDELLDEIRNISFILIGLNGEFKPSQICDKCDKIFDGVENGIKALQLDISVPETPVLSGLLTAEIITDYELGKIQFPKELIEIYDRNYKERLSKSGLQVLDLSDLIGRHTVH